MAIHLSGLLFSQKEMEGALPILKQETGCSKQVTTVGRVLSSIFPSLNFGWFRKISLDTADMLSLKIVQGFQNSNYYR